MMSSENSLLNKSTAAFVETLGAFFRPLTNKGGFLVWPAIIITVVWLHVSTDARELAEVNRMSVCVLAAEMLNESGPSFKDASPRHLEMLGQYAKHMDERHLTALAGRLYPQCQSREALEAALSILKTSPVDNEEAKDKIWRAGQQICPLCHDPEGSSQRPVVWFRSERLPDWLVKDIGEALANSHDAVVKLEREQSVANALTACEANRRTILLVVLGWLGYHNEEKLTQFSIDVEKARCLTNRLAENAKGDPTTQRQLVQWAQSEDFRGRILEARRNHDFWKASDLARAAIERAYEEKLEQDSGSSY